jgi:hypothetical protein
MDANDFVQSTFPLLNFSASPLFRFSTLPLRGRMDGRKVLRRDKVQALDKVEAEDSASACL